MVGAKTGVLTPINETESHVHLTDYHGHALETIKVIKIIRGTIDAAFELRETLDQETLVTEHCAEIVGRSEGHCCKSF